VRAAAAPRLDAEQEFAIEELLAAVVQQQRLTRTQGSSSTRQ
jgi:hypothetical protein